MNAGDEETKGICILSFGMLFPLVERYKGLTHPMVQTAAGLEHILNC